MQFPVLRYVLCNNPQARFPHTRSAYRAHPHAAGPRSLRRSSAPEQRSICHCFTCPTGARHQGIKAFSLCTGPDNLSHVIQGTIDQSAVADAGSLNFKETPAHATYDWHPAPQEQYVITLSGTLEFSTTGGENFVLHPGEVLLAQDITGLGHRWKLIDDQPWRRAYILTTTNAAKAFIPKEGSYDKGGCQV